MMATSWKEEDGMCQQGGQPPAPHQRTPRVTLMCVGDPHSKLRQVFIAGGGEWGMWP